MKHHPISQIKSSKSLRQVGVLSLAAIMAAQGLMISSIAAPVAHASGSSNPLSVNAICVDEQVVLQAQVDGSKTHVILSGRVGYISDFGSSPRLAHSINPRDIDRWSINTGHMAVPASTVKAEVSRLFGIDLRTHTANYDALNCDTTGPIISQISPEDNALVGNTLSLRFDVQDPSGVRNVNIHVFQNNTTKMIIPLVHMGGNIWGVDNYDISPLEDGQYSFVSRAVDNQNNLRAGTGTNHGRIRVDQTAPTITVKSGSNFTVGNGNVFSKVSFKLFDAGMIDYVEINGVKKDLSNNTWSDVNFVKPGVFGAVEGHNTIVAFDLAGNSQSFDFVLDTIDPISKVESPVDGDVLSGDVEFKITASDDNLVAYSFRIQNLTTGQRPVEAVPSTTTSINDQLVFTWDTTAWDNGEYYMYTSARDAAGNRSEDRIHITVANTAPEVITPTEPETEPTSTPTPTPNSGQTGGDVLAEQDKPGQDQPADETPKVLAATGGQSLMTLGMALLGLGGAGFASARNRKKQS